MPAGPNIWVGSITGENRGVGLVSLSSGYEKAGPKGPYLLD